MSLRSRLSRLPSAGPAPERLSFPVERAEPAAPPLDAASPPQREESHVEGEIRARPRDLLADDPFARVFPPLLVAFFTFPDVAWIVSRIDRRRLGR